MKLPTRPMPKYDANTYTKGDMNSYGEACYEQALNDMFDAYYDFLDGRDYDQIYRIKMIKRILLENQNEQTPSKYKS